MNLHFLFPSDPLDPKRIDEAFSDQAAAFIKYGIGHSLVNTMEAKFHGRIPEDSTVVYRGWMLTPEEYEGLNILVTAKGSKLLTSPEEYVLCHYLPNWYPLLKEFTAETLIFPGTPNVEELVQAVKMCLGRSGWEKCFVKDYVKSLKIGDLATLVNPDDVSRTVEAMNKYRGTVEGGLCIRRWEKLADEQRFFVVNGKLSWEPSCTPPDDYIPVAVGVMGCIRVPFYSIDIARREDGAPRLVEIGDGQVSDLVGWTPEAFVKFWEVAHQKQEFTPYV
jgi:hypothetical protein